MRGCVNDSKFHFPDAQGLLAERHALMHRLVINKGSKLRVQIANENSILHQPNLTVLRGNGVMRNEKVILTGAAKAIAAGSQNDLRQRQLRVSRL
jgi:hypothetical protein